MSIIKSLKRADEQIAQEQAHIAELEAAIDRVRRLHSQHSDIGLADGAYCPGCGFPVPCPTERALRGER